MKMTFILLHWFSNYGRRTTRGTWAPSKGMCGICFFFSIGSDNMVDSHEMKVVCGSEAKLWR